tara:strand:- start:150 stop:428 length:279 start_codon:yes stop_codon:yes gene_type:complete
MDSLLSKLKRRTSSTIPFGYELSEYDTQYIKPITSQLEALYEVEDMVVNELLSLRDACLLLENNTGRKISPAGLKKIIDKKYGTRQERLDNS